MPKCNEPPQFNLAEAEVEPDAQSSSEDGQVAPIPEELIQPNEIIIMLIKPSYWYIILGSLKELVIVGIIWLIALYCARAEWLHVSTREVNLFAAGVTGAILLYRFMDWLGRAYMLTDRRVVRVKGIFRISVFETQLKQIQHTETYFSIRERFFGLGTIGFATAGTGGMEAYWLTVAKPLEVHRLIVQTIHRYS